jgi:hypothetical protein
MERGVNPQPLSPQKRQIFRKQIVIPSEHGSWSWFFVPYFVGLLVAGQWNVPAFLVLVGGLAGFLIRQPASVYLRIRNGKGRRSDESLRRVAGGRLDPNLWCDCSALPGRLVGYGFG